YQRETEKIKEVIRKESTFILTSNDLDISAEAILLEYKTQSNVKKTDRTSGDITKCLSCLNFIY
ncbi:MAG: hypothetical protein WA113_11675, partial [Desulfitobacteriaceae bacterium]